MATPEVSLKSKKSPDGTVFYYLDYGANGKRFRPKLGTNKKDVELVRAKVERDILLGTYQITPTKRNTLFPVRTLLATARPEARSNEPSGCRLSGDCQLVID